MLLRDRPDDHEHAAHRARRARARRRSSARARPRWPTTARCRRNSCWPICRTRARRSRRSPDGARRTICSRISSRASVSANDSERIHDSLESRGERDEIVRRDRDRRRPRRLRGRVRRGAARRARRPLHAVDRHRRAHAVQSGDRRHRQGPSRARDRRARRADGPRDRRDRHSVQAAQSQPRAGGLVAARAGRQEGLRPAG